MMRANVIVALVGMMAAQAAPKTAQPNLSGEWSLASATLNVGSGEQPTTQFVSDYSAFNCGRECRIVYKGSTLTIENAKLDDGATAARPTVTIVVDG